MKSEVVQGISRLLDRRIASGLEELRLSFFGGEPLLAKDIVLAIARHGSALAKQFPTLDYRGGITSNGWRLTAATATELAAVGVTNFQVTLDGPSDLHDLTRRRAGGGPTFERIWGNLQAIATSAAPVHIGLRCHVTAKNADSWTRFAPELRALCADPRFTVQVNRVERLGGPNDEDLAIASATQMDSVRAVLARSSPRPTTRTSATQHALRRWPLGRTVGLLAALSL